MTKKRSKLAKFFIYLTLIFIVFASFAAYIVMYAWINGSSKSKCQEWYIFDEERGQCIAQIMDIDNDKNNNEINPSNSELNDEESCELAGWTWYQENNICILPDAQ